MAQPQDHTFYLGKLFDAAQGKLKEEQVRYDPAHLTTHAIVTGMTGSGKTGLCVGLLEEAALQGIPAIIIDPKGDLTNLILHFPDQTAKDFEPWLDPQLARRAGKDIPTLAAETAQLWKDGQASWGLGKPDLLNLKSAVQFTIFTPGSSAGKKVNILSSFQSPEISWEANSEILREKISSIVTALLALVGMTGIDPLKSREHILLSNLIENAWSQGLSLDLTELILQTQTPPFERLGAFPLDSFFPPKERQELAMMLNNFLASPSFQSWLEGQSLDIGSMLYMPDGKPRHSIFYLAHLNDNERMFFVSLLLASVETWMRSQRGTSDLRALVYFDEIMGYLPPVANPPSRPILLRMLKQARAFGLGLLLATQNPIDLDYKAISNAGTWMIGRLQTEQDKERLLDGLMSATGSGDRSHFDKLLSGLQKRVFLLHNVNKQNDLLFQTRWTLNYLAGPLTREQIAPLNLLAGAPDDSGSKKKPPQAATSAQASAPAGAASAAAAIPSTSPAPIRGSTDGAVQTLTATRPAIPSGVDEYFLPAGVTSESAAQGLQAGTSAKAEGLIYRPALLGQVEVRYLARKYNVEATRSLAVILQTLESNLVKWEANRWEVLKPDMVLTKAQQNARYAALPAWLSDPKRIKSLRDDFEDWVYRTAEVRLRANEKLKVYAAPDVTTASFRDMCSQAAREAMQEEQKKIDAVFKKKLQTLQQKMERQGMEVSQAKQELDQRRMEEIGSAGELLFSVLAKRRKGLSSTLSKHRQASEAQADLEAETKELEALEKEYADAQKEQADAMAELQDRWGKVVGEESELPFMPTKKDVFTQLFGIIWLPFYVFRVGETTREVAAFSSPAK